MTLETLLKDPERRASIVADGVLLVDQEVSKKKGIRGAALKAGYRAFRAIRPGIVAEAMNALLPAFAPALDPHITRAGSNVGRYFDDHAGDVADSLLAVTDRRAERAKHRLMKRIYRSLRAVARPHVVAAMPGLAEVIERQLASPTGL